MENSVISVTGRGFSGATWRASLEFTLWAWMGVALAASFAAWAAGGEAKRILEALVVALSPALTGFILVGRLREPWARGYLAFAWIAAATMLAASSGGVSSPLAAAFILAPAYAVATGETRLLGGAVGGAVAGYLGSAWLAQGIDPAPLAIAPPVYAAGSILTAGLVFWSVTRRAAEDPEDTRRHIAEAAHELRTPLNHIIGFAEMIEKQIFGPAEPRYVEYAGLIRQSGEQLVEQVTRRLDLTRIASGRYDLEFETFDACKVATDVARLSESSAAAKNIALETCMPERALLVRADAGAVRQILTNLIGNAIKFTPQGGRVSISAHAGEGMLTLEVADTGPGIPATERARLLEPFARGKNGRRKEGAGLGLALARALAQLHDGSLRLSDAPGGGLLARVRLPLMGPATSD